jgi:DNA-binding beta-propeller fold protein YncE
VKGLLVTVFLVAALGVPSAIPPVIPSAMVGSGGSVPEDPEAVYRIYVGAESADLLHRIRFGPDGASVEASIPVGALYEQSGVPELYSESEAPHGVAVDPRNGVVYMTTGHGLPDGKLWKVEAGTGRLLGGPLDLGRFPASLGVSPDGRFVTVANFNLHGEMTPSSISVVFAGGMVELARIETCTMPHGSRIHPGGRHHYSVCMMDDQLVEIDLGEMDVSRRFFLGTGEEGPLPATDRGFHDPHNDPHHGHQAHGHQAQGHQAHGHPADPSGPGEAEGRDHYRASCSPTWVQPSHDGLRLYVACNASDQVLEVDREAWRVTRRFPTGRGPYNLDVTPDDGTLVVTLKQGDGVEFIDLSSGETMGRSDTSIRVVHGVALASDGRYAFISVEGVGSEPGRVEIYDLQSFRRVAEVAVGQQASGVAFWSITEPEGG